MNRLESAMRVPAWQDNLRASCLHAGFRLQLTRPMCEFLSAVADGVKWDRSEYGSANAFPDNFLATAAALFKRGLIRQVAGGPTADWALDQHRANGGQLSHYTHWELTPAGAAVVELLKLAGLFVEADAAIEKKAKGKGRL